MYSTILAALRKAAQWARTLERLLHVAAAYGTAFHQQVFQVMARSRACCWAWRGHRRGGSTCSGAPWAKARGIT